ncbi:hypothetical protein [Enhydrobacter sp.]|jgi:hypothetical protein|uniref:hypothetical protein n=1 Tax=Enhydrobacter sp. TaxID=1894999 RepID=UPI00263A21D7|nr:hypothetical protein [Enhydrobacter sp.]WIM10598.1 MAG: hypothetical protein OJF58_001554 [Enhydrobacter sp.]
MASQPTDFQISAVAEMLAEAGFSSRQAMNRLRYLATQDAAMLNSYGKRAGSGKTSAYLYPLHEVCKVKVLFALMDSGIADMLVLSCANAGLIAGFIPDGASEAVRKRLLALKGSPIQRAIEDIRKGGWPSFVLTYFRNSDNGAKYYRGTVLLTDEKPESGNPADPYIPRTSIVVDLRSLLLPLLRDRANEN